MPSSSFMPTSRGFGGRGPACGLLAVLMALVFSWASPTQAAAQGRAISRLTKLGRTAAERKVNHRIREVTDRLARAGVTPSNARQLHAPAMSTRFVTVDDSASLKVLISVADTSAATLAELKTLPLEIQLTDPRHDIVQALVPYNVINGVAALDVVTRITGPGPKLNRAGAVHSEGDGVVNADAVRLLGFDGIDTTVGVMSDGVDGLVTSVGSGDVPIGIDTSCGASSAIDCSCSMAGAGPADGAEGTAMLEIVHDLAPGADLVFGNFDTQSEFAAVIGCLAAKADVLVDDIIFLAEPVFEDGIVAQAVDAAVASGAVYFSAAGNDADEHVEDTFSDVDPGTEDTAIPPTGVDFHDFGGGDAGFTVTVNPGGSIIPTLHWDEPYGAAAQDYDLYIYDSAFPGALNMIDASIAFQGGTEDPVEITFFQNNTSDPITVNVVIEGFSVTEAKLMKLHLFGRMITVDDVGFLTPTREIYGHAAAAGAVAVGAVPWSGPDLIEPFSSRGPVQILFPDAEVRSKPEFVAPDGVSVTGNGGFPSMFFGTSAAAPHAAAVAALLLDRQPTLTPALVRLALADGAADLGLAGVDDTYGSGRIDALAAVNSLVCGNGTLDPNEVCDDGNFIDGDGCTSGCEIEACYTCSGEPSLCATDDEAPCDDGEPCTSGDTCSGGACLPGTPIAACADGDGCCPGGCEPEDDTDCVVPVPGLSTLSGLLLAGLLAALLMIVSRRRSSRA
jgi:cysteine-rich repeat protein